MTAQTDERAQLTQEYLDLWRVRGHVETDEARAQAAAYADRILANRAWEQERIEAARQLAARQAAAQRSIGTSKRQVAEANLLRVGDTAADEAWARQVAANVARNEDPKEQQRRYQASQQRLARGRTARAERVATLRAELEAQAGTDRRVLMGETKLLRQALDDLDADLFREALKG